MIDLSGREGVEKSRKIILGYSTSHDCGIAGVDSLTGEPLFAASLERLSRIKNHEGSPLALLGWLPEELSRSFAGWEILPIGRNDIYRSDNGFHELEKTGNFIYRWTSDEAFLRFEPARPISRIFVELVSETISRRRMEADITVNGRFIRRIDNSRSFLDIKSNVTEPVAILSIKPVHVFRPPADPRTLGIMIRTVAVRGDEGPQSCRSGNGWHAMSDVRVEEDLFRFLHKEFVVFSRKGLRRHKPRQLVAIFRDYLRVILTGYHTHSEMRMRSALVRASSRFDHHECHAASAYFPSGFNTALVVSLDGIGNNYSCRIWRGEDGLLKPLKAYYCEELPAGSNYELVTAMLGFNPLRHAGKITGLAAFGKDNVDCETALDSFLDEIWTLRSTGRSNRKTFNHDDYLESGPRGLERLRLVRQERFGHFTREDIAHAIQKRTEQQICGLIAVWKEQCPDLENVALAGGVFGNVKLNQHIKEIGFRNIFIQPAMSDAGLPLGAAFLEVAKRNGGRLAPFRLKDVFLGIGFNDEQIKAEIDKEGLRTRYVTEEEIAPVIARAIADRKVVAHFHGRMEFGPRALGNRSILYSAADANVNKWLNDQLHRTEFMPFAPAVAYEAASDYFKNVAGAEYAAEFMTITFECTEKAQREIPAAIHIDNTARPQLVHEERNPRFYHIVKAYEAITGVPVVINTSFNMHEEPIVATPYDAIRCFQLGHLDVLVVGNYIIEAIG